MEFIRQEQLPKGALPVYRAERTAKHHRRLVRKEAAAKNRPADIVIIVSEKVVEAGLELHGFSVFDEGLEDPHRGEASIQEGIPDRMSPVQRAGLLWR